MSDITDRVRERYGAAARKAQGDHAADCGCGCNDRGSCCGGGAGTIALTLGYSEKDVAEAGEGNLGLGCGNPLALARIAPGMTVLDLGSGAGFDAFLAAARVGPTGRVIGVDMTPDMIALARKNAAKRGDTNVEFRAGRLEALPVDDASVDLILSNCVLNLVPEKERAFREAARVLKPGGTLSVSDLVLLAPLSDALRQNVTAYVGCVAGASPLGEYVSQLFDAGLVDVAVTSITPAGAMLAGLGVSDADRASAERALVSANFVARKPR